MEICIDVSKNQSRLRYYIVGTTRHIDLIARFRNPVRILQPGGVDLAPSQYPDDPFVDDTFGLSFDNIFFLDQVFMGDSASAEWNSTLQIANAQDSSSTTDEVQSNTQQQHEEASTASAEALDHISGRAALQTLSL